jgi:L-threonylcarbamoyladenylate synthase
MNPEIARAVALLRAGELVAMPTETVYGLAADATNSAAVARIFAVKGRPVDHPLIVHLPDAKALDAWARDVPDAARRLAGAFWPGPLTLILKRRPHVLDAVTGGQDTVGLRMPNHPLALTLLREFGKAKGAGQAVGLAAPSANRYGRISPTSADDVRAELGAGVSMVLAITASAIAHLLGVTSLSQKVETSDIVTPRVAGSDSAHYAPHTPLRLIAGNEMAGAIDVALAAGQRLAVLARNAPPRAAPGLAWHVAANDAGTYAHDLYARLRALDAADVDLILVEALPMTDEWLAVADRLQRAACGSGESDET